MKTVLEYKGYVGSADLDVENNVLVGKLQFISDVITYSGETPQQLEAAFRDAVDDYLATCAEDGSEPDVPFKGSFNVRIGPERHRAAALAARRQGIALNEFVCAAIDAATHQSGPIQHVHKHEFVIVPQGDKFTRVAGSVNPPAWESIGGRSGH